MFKCDYHTHSRYSPDASASATVDALCEAAIKKGVTDLAITDHFECNARTEYSFPTYDHAAAYEEMAAAKEKYKGKLHLTIGIEIGQASQYPEDATDILSKHGYEFVIGSVHSVKGAPDFYFLDFEKLSAQPEYIGYFFNRYVDELCETVDILPKLDTVGHLTYMRRYCEMAGLKYDFSKHSQEVERLFKKMTAKDIALEVNVSTLWRGLGFAMPDKEFLELYRECGGRLITVGTDSHTPDRIGSCTEEGFALLRSVDLHDILVIRNGKKEIIKI